jgi:RecA/RadA recombinase
MARAKNTDKKTENVVEVRYTSGCTLLDLAVGGEKDKLGFLGGKWVNLVGDTQAGKSLLAVETVVANKYRFKDDFKIFYDDTEDGCTFDVEERHGFLMKPEGATDSETVEEMSHKFTRFLESFKPTDRGIYAVDSLDGLADEATVEMDEDRNKAFDKGKEYDKGTFGVGLPKFLSQNYFKLKHGLLDDAKALCIITSQVRQNINGGMYGPKFVRAGGKALDLYANYIIWLTTKQILEKDGRAVGAVVLADIKKAKVPRPHRKIMYTVLYDYGIDDVATCIDFLYDCRSEKTGELLKRADSLVWDEGMEPMSKDELIKYIEENRLKKELRRRTIEKWEQIEDAIASNRPSKYEEDEDNV